MAYGDGSNGSDTNGTDLDDYVGEVGLNPFDGSGRGVVFAYNAFGKTTTGVVSPDGYGCARGLISTSTGTIKVKLMSGAIVQMPVFEGEDCYFNIHTIYADGVGDVPIADITLIW